MIELTDESIREVVQPPTADDSAIAEAAFAAQLVELDRTCS